jgi:hypothetical protein
MVSRKLVFVEVIRLNTNDGEIRQEKTLLPDP